MAILTKDQEREKNCRFAFVVNIQYKRKQSSRPSYRRKTAKLKKLICPLISSNENRAYTLQVDNEEVHVYCHMTNDLMGCGGDGWTLVMKMNGTKVSCLLSYKGEK